MALSTMPKMALAATFRRLLFATVVALFINCSGSADEPSGEAKLKPSDCQEDWKKLLKMDINIKDSENAKYSPGLSTKADALEYVLIKPAGAVRSQRDGSDIENRYSLWAYFKCNEKNGRLTHDHCRFGESGEAFAIKIPVSKIFMPTYDSIATTDGMFYVCREETTIDKMTSLVYPSAHFWDDASHVNEEECRRIGGSQWCGAGPQIEKNGCVDNWKILQHNMAITTVDPPLGSIKLTSSKSIAGKKRVLNVALSCDEKHLLKPLSCSPDNFEALVIPAGQFATFGRVYYGCPRAKVFGTAAELEKAVAIVELKEQTTALPSELTGFEEYQPAKIGECTNDWKVLIDGGRRDFDSNGYVRIQKQRDSTNQDSRYSGKWKVADALWAFFVCKAGGLSKKKGLKMDHCRVGEEKQLAAGRFRKVDDYYFNCGAKKSTTVANVETMVTTAKKAAAGLVAT